MSSIQSIKQLAEEIWRLEVDLDLLDKSLGGVKVWQLLRMEIYYALSRQIGLFTVPHTQKESFIDIVKTTGALVHVATRSPLRGNYKKNTLVFDHARKILVDGTYVDIYTQPLLDALSEKDVDIVESIYLGKHLSKKASNRKYLEELSVGSFIYRKFRRVNLLREERRFIEMLKGQIESRFGVSLNLFKMFYDEIMHFRFSFSYYTKLLLKRRPDKIYLVVWYSYYKRSLIAAAKALGIETIEIQHGTISPYHLGYNFPNTTNELDYFPSRFYTFGDYWKCAARFPLPDDHIVTYGFPHFNMQKRKYAGFQKKPDQILFISQGVIGGRLADFAYRCAKMLPEKKFVYKLHPGEYDRWRAEYPSLVKAALLDNVEVVDNNERHLYDYFAESFYQVGAFSTAIYEGLAFDCRTIIVDLPGTEYMDDLLSKGIVKKVSTPEAMVQALSELKEVSFDSMDFFACVSN